MSVLVEFDRRRRCRATRARLDAHLLGELGARERLRLARHLGRCTDCAAEAASRRELLALLPRALPPRTPPPELLARLLARVRRAAAPRGWSVGAGAAAAAAAVVLVALVMRPLGASSMVRALESPQVAVINLFAALDCPLSARYEYRGATAARLDRSVGRILYDTSSGEWSLVVHGLPRPPEGAHYALAGLVGDEEVELARLDDWRDGEARLHRRARLDLARLERISLQLVSEHSRLRLLEAVGGLW